MKTKIKKIVLPLFLSVLCGALCGRVVYSVYASRTELVFTGDKIYLLQTGAYSSYDNMRASTIGNNYVYFREEGLYKTIIAITKDTNNIDKIKDLYGGEIIVNSYYLNDKKLNNEIIRLDKELTKSEKEEDAKQIVIKMLDLYKQYNDIKLVKIS